GASAPANRDVSLTPLADALHFLIPSQIDGINQQQHPGAEADRPLPQFLERLFHFHTTQSRCSMSKPPTSRPLASVKAYLNTTPLRMSSRTGGLAHMSLTNSGLSPGMVSPSVISTPNTLS